MIRVITGIAKGRKLFSPKGLKTRPTTDMVRGALFNVLGNLIIDANIIDLYSGTGALGIEALSRGARNCVFVDNDDECINIIKKNLELTGLQGIVLKGDAEKVIAKLKDEKYDIVFADPPYGKDLARNLLSALDKCSILKNFTFVVIQHYKKDVIDEPLNWKKIQTKKYGDTVLSFYKSR